MNNKAVIYSRISTTNNQTVDNQVRILREVAEKKGLEIVKEISDEGISGAKGRDEREGFDELIKGAVKKEFDIILVWDVSRLGRSLKHLVSFLDDIHSSNCDLYIHQSGMDTTSASGKMMFGMIALFSELARSLVNRFCSMQLWKTVRSSIGSRLQRLFKEGLSRKTFLGVDLMSYSFGIVSVIILLFILGIF